MALMPTLRRVLANLQEGRPADAVRTDEPVAADPAFRQRMQAQATTDAHPVQQRLELHVAGQIAIVPAGVGRRWRQQLVGRDVDQHDFIGIVQHRVGHGGARRQQARLIALASPRLTYTGCLASLPATAWAGALANWLPPLLTRVSQPDRSSRFPSGWMRAT